MIRKATLADAARMTAIFNQNLAVLVPDNNPQAIEVLQAGHGEEQFRERIVDTQWLCKVYENSQSECEGFICVRLPQHIFSLYVTPTRQGAGLGSQLFDSVLRELTVASLTVNASVHSLGFYTKLGFIAQSECQTQKGVQFTPMSLFG